MEKEEVKEEVKEDQVEKDDKSPNNAEASTQQTNEEPTAETSEGTSAEKEEPIAKAESTDALANRKYAEGAKKKEKEILSRLGVASIDEAVSLINSAKEQGANYTELAAKSICTDLDVKKEFREDVIDLCKGKGLEVNEENVKAILSKHPEWVKTDDESSTSVVEIGNTGGKSQPQRMSEREKVHSYFK